jgi:uncharacterized protein YjbI with pentapeptide repeats
MQISDGSRWPVESTSTRPLISVVRRCIISRSIIKSKGEGMRKRKFYEMLADEHYLRWNQWREKNPTIKLDLSQENFSLIDLSYKNLSHINFKDAYFRGVNLYGANLTNANLSGANLYEANLHGARLANANLKRSNLKGANLYHAILDGADLSESQFAATKLIHNDLSNVKGLETVYHQLSSFISIDTIYLSNGKIPDVFLRGVGISDTLIAYIPSLLEAEKAIRFNSCFISYNSKDEQFVKLLYSRMRDKNMRVWFAPEDVTSGQKLHEQIEHAIELYDRLLLVLSENSMQSEWVATEIRSARRVEVKEKRRKLFPIRLVNFDTIKEWKCFDGDQGKDLAVEVREYFIPDFSDWNNPDLFESAFERLLRDLKTEAVS